MTLEPVDLDYRFTAPIGVDVKNEIWSCVEMPGSAAFCGVKRLMQMWTA